MKQVRFEEALEHILERDERYSADAYGFVREALDHAIELHEKPRKGAARHVSGQELLAGIRDYALREFGPMAMTVLHRWGVHRCEDFGEIVFNLVKEGVLGKTDEDSRADFRGGYDFDEAFRAPFRDSAGHRRETPTDGA